MKQCLGKHSKPTTPLKQRHVTLIENVFEQQLLVATNSQQHPKACWIAGTNLTGWYACSLQAQETFSLKWGDIDVLSPAQGPTLTLPPGIGVILLHLLPQTKSLQSGKADIVLSYTLVSGLSLGKWLDEQSLV
jgi:hypothetical protein